MGTNTGIGIGIGIPFKNFSSGGRQPLPPDLKASLKGVWIAYGKSNNDADRSIVKNLVDPDNPFVISNAAYTEGSGYADKDSPYYGAFVTDGIDDLITSTKTVQEMLGGSNEITVVSMAHFIKGESDAPEICRINQIRRDTRSIRNSISKIGKSGIFGYTYKNGVTTINNILGDKNDCTAEGNLDGIVAPFSVEGYYYNNNSTPLELCSIAWYWTIIANKVLITDQINQVIAYFNLDRTLKPDILCNTIKQGITNENHAEFGDKLIDFSGNGRDIQLNNLAWKGDSGIGKYEVDFLDSSIWNSSNSTITSSKIDCKNAISHIMLLYYSVGSKEYPDIPSFKVIKTGADIDYSYIDETGSPKSVKIVDGVNVLPASHNTLYSGSGRFCGFGNPGMGNSVTITQIPSHAGALWLDGVNDFGKVTGMPIYKDYTVVTDREIFANIGAILSKNNPGAFVETAGNSVYSFGQATSGLNFISTRSISYLSKYSYCGQSITAGAAEDGTDMWLGTIRDNDSRFFNGAIYSLMSFPYSMSEFLIERQLKKHKLGTLYPNMVEFRPVIKSNASYDNIVFYYKNEKIENGTYLTVGSSIGMHIRLSSSPVNEIKSITINGIPATFKFHDANDSIYQYGFDLTSKSPQKINITIDEYIRFEDIVQPYPVLLRFKDENGNEVSWGDKIKLGSSIIRIGSFNDCNLLKDIYTVSNAKLNGSPLPSTPHVVERQMVFTCTATWIFDNNEPKCVLSPRLLRVPNSSYKILGYIPDISGHGNHAVIYNSAYKLNSGANGYLVDFTTFQDYGNKGIVRTDSKIYLDESFDYDKGFWLGYTNSPSPTYKVRVSGIPKDGVLSYTGGSWINLINGINELPARTNTKEIHGFFAQTPNVDWSKLVIEQIGEYEGAYCLDGINDFITIPILSKGGKQVLMKVNWQKQDTMLYNQNPGQDNFAIFANNYNRNNLVVAYAARNNGNTYIDGVVNNNILATQLKDITHNIVATNNNIDTTITPIIGANKNHDNFFAQMSLYDFMLFDEISTDDKIKELNTYIGITPKVTLPNYYWDNYGKKNTDAKRGYIDEQVSLQKTGTSVNPLENFNIGYEGMSGYNGYPVVLGANKTWETSNTVYYSYDINSTIVHITNVKHAANGLLYSYVKKEEALANIKEIPAFRVTVKGLEENSKLIYKYLATENATKISIVYLGNGIHKLPKSFVPTDALLDLTINSWIGFAITPMIEGELVFDCDITIEILPEYENGLVYDGVSDFTDNKNIPIFTDFTAIIKRVDLDAKNDNSTVMFKGNKIYESSIGNGFILDYCYDSKNCVYSYGKLNQIERDDSKIIYLTPKSYNGNPIIKGENRDNLGLVLGKYWKGIIYKTILYSKTISLLEINFLKNLMEKDEIIDINHPIFISNTEDESNASQDT